MKTANDILKKLIEDYEFEIRMAKQAISRDENTIACKRAKIKEKTKIIEQLKELIT